MINCKHGIPVERCGYCAPDPIPEAFYAIAQKIEDGYSMSGLADARGLYSGFAYDCAVEWVKRLKEIEGAA